MRGIGFIVCAITALAGSTVSAQNLVYRVDNNGSLGSQQAVPSPANTIALGSFSGDLVLYIYDTATVNGSITTGTSALDAPAITITGTPATGARLLVAFADGDVPSMNPIDWAALPVLTADRGRALRSLGGLSFGSTTLRDRSMLIARIGTGSAGDVSGAIDVGRIRTLDVSGSITADLTSRLLDNTPESASDAGLGVPGFSIDRIRVGNQIDGTITAAADSATGFTGSTGSIGTIVVDGTDAAGITKDVLALKGSIGSIYTTGPIGTSATAQSKIWARNGIREIIAGGESVSSPQNALEKNFFADVDASKGVTTTVGGDAYRIWTKGDYTGDINAWAVKAPASVSDSPTTGIIVGGTFNGSIKIVGGVFRGAIVANEFTGPIELGGLVGSIVARTGDIPRVSILGSRATALDGFAARGVSGQC